MEAGVGRHAQPLRIWDVLSKDLHAVAQEGREIGVGAGVYVGQKPDADWIMARCVCFSN